MDFVKNLFNPKIFFIYLLFLAGSIGTGIVIPLLASLEGFYGPIHLTNNIMLGFGSIEAIFIIITTISLIFWGYIIDARDRKFWIGIGLIIFCIGNIIISLSGNNLHLYFIGRCIFTAIGLGVINPASYSLAGDVMSFNNRSTISGGISVVILLGSGLGIILGGLLGSYSIKFPFNFSAILGLLLILLLWIYKEPIRGMEEPEIKNYLIESEFHQQEILELESQLSKSLNILSIKNIFSRRTNIFMFLQGIFALIPSSILTYYLVAYLNDSTSNQGLNIPLFYATLLSLGPASGRIFGYLILGKIGDLLHNNPSTFAFGKGKVLIAGITMILQAPIFTLAFFIDINPYNELQPNIFDYFLSNLSFLVLFGLFFFIGSFIGAGSGPNRRALTFDINEPEFRGQASSIFSIGDQLGASIGLFLGSILIFELGYRIAFIILCSGYLVAGIIWLLALKTIVKDENEVREIISSRIKSLES